MSAEGYYGRVTPEELGEAVRDREFEERLEETLFDDDGHDTLCIWKAWDGIKYLLTAAGAPIDVILGGTPISDLDWSSQGPGRYLTPDQVKQMAAFFQETPMERLAAHFDPVAMAAAHIYTVQPDNADWLEGVNYEFLVEFFATAASAGDAIITMIG